MTIEIKSYLRDFHQESMPEWLAAFRKGDSFDRERFFGSRIVRYPGYGDDGQPVRLFGAAGAAHVFIYADYAVRREELIQRLGSADRGFRGYEVLDILDLEQGDLVPDGWAPTLPAEMLQGARHAMRSGEAYGMLAILERQEGFQGDHGPERLAILFLGADGIATYDALFCQPASRVAPFGMVIQDHGFGGNYSSFGRSGRLYKIARAAHVFPKFLLAEKDGSRGCDWPGYDLVDGLEHDLGGMHANHRFLFERAARQI